MPATEELLTLAKLAAERHHLNAALVCAVIEQESGWNTNAIRYEPAFRMRYVAPLALPPTEEIARSISWGLMQVMGQVAREHGFDGKFLAQLCEPAAGLEIGCTVLAAKLSKAQDDTERGLMSWNGGADSAYAGQVLNRIRNYRPTA